MIKTITLSGGEVAVALDGAHAHIRNDGADIIYAAKAAGITAGADGVASIPAGQADTVRGISGVVYLLGTGSVHIQSDDYVVSPFKSSAQAGGSGADEVARAAINAHAGNAEIHVTAEEKAEWSAVNYVNPNLLTNPDFAVNQRGLASYSYSSAGYTVDRWKINNNAQLTVNDGFVTFENTTEKATVTLYQIVENPVVLSGKTVTLSFDYDLKTEGASITIQALANGSWTLPVPFNSTGRSVKSNVITLPENLTDLRLVLIIHSTDSAPLAIVDVYGAKLELGSIATPIIPADPATELAKCQRYYQIRSTGDIAAVDLRPSMRTITDIKQRSDGYEYIAEL